MTADIPAADDPRLPAGLFSPRGVAILGASAEPGKLAHRPLEYLRRHGFPGAVYPINPHRDQILGWPCRRDLAAVDGPIDVALISLAAASVPAALQACAARGIPLAIVLTSGLDPDLAVPPGLLVMGPNSMGFINARRAITPSWSASLDRPDLRSGRVGFITQSGALGGSILNRLQDRGVGLSYAFLTGNEARLDTCHFLQFLLDDPDTEIVALLIEGLRRPRRFLALAALALERRKPLIVLKLARTAASTELALAHTGQLAGAVQTYRAAFRQHGVVAVDGLDELVDTTALFARAPLPAGDGLGVVGSSGGVAVLVTDLCHELGLRLPDLSEATRADVAAMLPPYAPTPTNPLDVTAGVSEATVFGPLERIARDPAIDVVLNVVTMLSGPGRTRERAEGLLAACDRIGKPLVACWLGGSLAEEGVAALTDTDLPYSTDLTLCLRSIKALCDYRARLARPIAPERPAGLEDARARARQALLAAASAGQRVLGERESAPLLAAYGLPLVPTRAAATPEEAVAAADALGYPVVLKVDAPGLAHKARRGGVRLGLRDAAAVAEAFAAITAAVRAADPALAVQRANPTVASRAAEPTVASRAADPALTIRGVLVQPEAPPGLEAMLGVTVDAQFGPQVLLGLGGIYAETLAAVAGRLAPLADADAADLIAETLLRAAPARAALVAALVRLSWFAADLADLVAECDLNPVRLYPDGLLALDALLVLTPTPQSARERSSGAAPG
jgi:acyl-CoA synthetase (NDP forming)